MRPLNRPMFKMGGAIKEGIMDGIREPKADGGNIGGGVIQGQPMGSRTGYRNPLPFLKSAFESAKNIFGRNVGTSGVTTVGGLGSLRQGITQAQLTADQQAAQQAAFEPQQRLQQYGAGLGQLAGFGAVAPQLPTGGEPSALDKALGTALGVGGLYAKIFAKPSVVIQN